MMNWERMDKWEIRMTQEKENTKAVLGLMSTLNPGIVIERVDATLKVEGTEGHSAKMSIRLGGSLLEKTLRLSVERLPDGTIATDSNQVNPKLIMLPDPSKKGSKTYQRSLGIQFYRNQEMKEVLVKVMDEQFPENMTDGLRGAIRSRAASIWASRLPKDTAFLTKGDDKFTGMEDLVRSLLDQKIWDIAKDRTGRVRPERYNRAVQSTGALEDLRETNPGAFTWAMDDQATDDQPYEHPGELIRDVRPRMEKYGVERRFWRAISQMPTETLAPVIEKALPRYMMAIVLNACGEAQVVPSKERMKQAVKMLEHMRRRSETLRKPTKNEPDTAPAARESARKILRLTFQQEDGKATLAREDIQHIADYAVNEMDNEQPVQSTTWGGLKKASERWVREINRQTLQENIERKLREQQGWLQEWNSLVGTTTFWTKSGREILISPLVNPVMLLEEGKAMEHCVGTYDRDCIAGKSRIFGLSEGHRRQGTTELAMRNGRWKAVQTRSFKNHPAPEPALEAAAALAEAYQREWEGTPETMGRHRTWLFSPESGERR